MTRPELLGLEVNTPDGRGSILSLHFGRVIVHLNRTTPNQEMKGLKRAGRLHYSYEYEDVEIIKGQYNFK